MERSEIDGRRPKSPRKAGTSINMLLDCARCAALHPGYQCCSVLRLRRGAGVERLDLAGVFLVHELALELHGRGQLVVLRRELLLDQVEFLDGLDPGELAVDLLDLVPDQLADLPRAAQAGV